VAAVLAVGGAIAILGGGQTPEPSIAVDSSDAQELSSAAPSRTAPPSQNAAPSPTQQVVDGLPVYTVSELLAGRSTGDLEGGPYALTGYWTNRVIMHSCAPPNSPPGELQVRCHDGEWGITEANEPIGDLTVDGRWIEATSAHLTPYIASDDEEVGAPLFREEIINGQRPLPVPIVVIGHFDDPRAADCQPEAVQLCADRFVIDRIVDFHPEAVPTPGITPPPSPFPFDSPPPAPFDAAECAGDVPYSFVGWIPGDELGLDRAVPTTAFAAITRDPIRQTGWQEDADTGERYRFYGRRVCFAAEWEDGSMGIDIVPGSAYREWEDGHKTPVEP
jgi:hypothetical protein